MGNGQQRMLSPPASSENENPRDTLFRRVHWFHCHNGHVHGYEVEVRRDTYDGYNRVNVPVPPRLVAQPLPKQSSAGAPRPTIAERLEPNTAVDCPRVSTTIAMWQM
jgi:hypothetical protein